MSRDDLCRGDQVLAVPFYSQQLERRRNQPFCAVLDRGAGGLEKDSAAKGDEISYIDKDEIDFERGSLGRLNATEMQAVIRAVRYAMRDDELSR